MIRKLVTLFKKRFYSPEKYLRSLGVKIGKNCSIASIEFGSEPYLIEVGNHVQITTGVRISTHGACWVFRKENPQMDVFGKVKIGDNVYIGNSVIILPGVTIGNNVIVGAGTIVSKSIESGNIVAGNPGRVIGTLNDFYCNVKTLDTKTKGFSYKEKRKVLENLDSNMFLKK